VSQKHQRHVFSWSYKKILSSWPACSTESGDWSDVVRNH